jgi:UDP-2-acetamido-2,6-beta-L-arabino-hexul-4-ose reductase
MKIGITGSNGFIGKHLALMLKEFELELVPFDRNWFEDKVALEKFVGSCDFIVHAAGVNRHESEDFLFKTNVEMSKKLTSAALSTSNKVHFVYLSSTHRDKETAYGRSKKESEQIFQSYNKAVNGGVSILILPNIFGEEQKPYYNSVVATFVEEILTNINSQINRGAEIEFLHVRHVVSKCLTLILQKPDSSFNTYALKGRVMSISSLHGLLASFSGYLENGVIPGLNDTLEIDLFNTFRYGAAAKCYSPFDIQLKSDERGVLFEVLRTGTLGQVFFSVTKPGFVRGGHFHTRKVERFCVIEGSAEIECINLFNQKKYTFVVSGEKPQNIDMLTYHLHSIKNLGKIDLKTLFWSNEHFDQGDTDTFSKFKI